MRYPTTSWISPCTHLPVKPVTPWNSLLHTESLLHTCVHGEKKKVIGSGIFAEPYYFLKPIRLKQHCRDLCCHSFASPPKPDIQSAQAWYTLHCSWNPPKPEKHNTQYINNSAPFLQPSSAQVHPARAQAPTTFRTCHQPCTALAPEIRSVHTAIASSCNKTEASKELIHWDSSTSEVV
jgi:hypothetical protein